MKIYLYIILLFCFLCTSLIGQKTDFPLPLLEEISLVSPEDYIGFEDDILEYITWLENNSLKKKKRKEVSAVFLKWIIGTPTVSIVLPDYIRKYSKRNEGLLILFMTGYSRFVINNPNKKSNQIEANLAGVNCLLDYYSKGLKMRVKKDKKIEKLLVIRKAGQLKQYIERQLK